MDTKRVRRALLDRTVLLLFGVLFVLLFAEIHLLSLVPDPVGSTVQPVLLLLSIPGKYVAAVGGIMVSSIVPQPAWTLFSGDATITVLFYLFAVVAAWIGRMLGRYASEAAHVTRLRYLGAGALALGFAAQVPGTCDSSGDCTFAGTGYQLFVLTIGGGLCAAGFGVVGVETAVRRIRSRSV